MERGEYGARLRGLVQAPPWCFDFVHVDADYLEIRGWALPPADPQDRGTFTINGAEFDSILYPLPWAKIGRLFWYWPGAEKTGFICRVNKTQEDLFAGGFARFQYVRESTLTPFSEGHSYYFCDPRSDDRIPLPDPTRRMRVHGDAMASAFRLEGYATMFKLQEILRRVTGRGYSDFHSLLDWGCGCGRLMRYLPAIDSVTGIDIDGDNIRWCRGAFPVARFMHVGLNPPTSLDTSGFDLVIGVSVFTHLREDDQMQWLAELRRVSKPGAILLLTVLGESTMGLAALPADLFSQWEERGFLDAGSNPFLNDVISDPTYYRNVFHTHAYVQRHWGRHFEVLDIVRGVVGNHQDVVVLRNIKGD